MKKYLCGLLAGVGLMLGSFAHAEVFDFDELQADGGNASAAQAAPQFVTNAGAKASAIMPAKGWSAMDDLSLENIRDLPEPGVATVLVIAVLAQAVLRARKIP